MSNAGGEKKKKMQVFGVDWGRRENTGSVGPSSGIRNANTSNRIVSPFTSVNSTRASFSPGISSAKANGGFKTNGFSASANGFGAYSASANGFAPSTNGFGSSANGFTPSTNGFGTTTGLASSTNGISSSTSLLPRRRTGLLTGPEISARARGFSMRTGVINVTPAHANLMYRAPAPTRQDDAPSARQNIHSARSTEGVGESISSAPARFRRPVNGHGT
ncbi:hypothetical protein CYLTODRAFT_226809 [Cylindrobasidium torrendii FP15055 ss-10]|uniref:Uncharacterized protein n=1 Tax=Cylindrobasidium torrendii FP15055 ss-10 TaxID=1314674 RepID=A0A0D7BH89_9AGAR|nr:hypothetical protein CYLTODRAFT_226809 [Cylindrobasidium torrendii FP15055 ss-10]